MMLFVMSTMPCITSPASEGRVQEALADLSQRIKHLEPRPDSKEPLVLQQIGLLIALLPEVCRLKRQIA